MTSFKLYRRSTLHVYLSKAFVLSWSLLEVMASGTPVLAEANPMMEELIEPRVNGALWHGDPASLGAVVAELLNTPERLKSWQVQARERLKPTFAKRLPGCTREAAPCSSSPFLTQH